MPLVFRSALLTADSEARFVLQLRRTVRWGAVLAAFGGVLSSGAFALGGSRAAQGVDRSQSRVLANHHPRWANPTNDAGPLPPDQRLEHLTIVLARSAEQQAAFEQFLSDQQTPGSPEYHHWLTPEEVGERFGLTEQNIGAVTGWLQSQGLRVNWVSPSRIFIGFGGTAADLGRAFQTELHYYKVDGVERMSVSSDPLVPEAIAPSTKAIDGLYTIEEHPLHHAGRALSGSPEMDAGNGAHFIAPADFATIYDVPQSFTYPSASIGIVGRSRTNFDDFGNFENRTGSYFSSPTEIVPTAFGGVDPGPAYTAPPPSGTSLDDQMEATMDVMRAGSVATGANLLLVVATEASGGIEADAQYLVQTTPVPVQVMSISFGECESAAGKSRVDFWDTLFQQGAAEGISTFVSSGDAGASGCDNNFETPPASPKPNSPNYICSSSYATCVGGTEFNEGSAPSLYWGAINSSELGSALSYIPEGGWNEPLNSKGSPQAASSGGGVSAYIATPSWQKGTGVPVARAGRYTPDIAFSAAAHDGYFGCFAAAGSNCIPNSNGEFYFEYFYGTSTAAPSMAGITAVLDQNLGGRVGNLNPMLYQMAASGPAAFHDVTVASSGVTNCQVNTPSMCNNSLPSASGLSGGQTGYPVTNGYDLVTGLGSLDAKKFLSAIESSFIPNVTVTPSATSITVLQPLTVTITLAAASGKPTPTGTVILTGTFMTFTNRYTSAVTTLSGGSASIVIPAGALGIGAIQLDVTYTPDAASSSSYLGATASSLVTVTAINPTLSIALSSSSITTAQPLTVTVGVTGPSGDPAPTGSVSLEGPGNYFQMAPMSAGSATFQIPAGLFPVGNDTVYAEYIEDAASSLIYNQASGQAAVVVAPTAKYTPNVMVTAASYAIAEAQPLPIIIVVNGGSGNPMPTGTVTLMSGNYSSAAYPLAGGVAAATIPAGTLPVGGDTIAALYAPDAASAPFYNNVSGAAAVSVVNPVKSTPVVTLTLSSSTLTNMQPLQVWISVSGASGFFWATGSVTLSGGGYNSGAMTLVNNGVNLQIPAGVLAKGTDTLTAAYTPDATSANVFTSATGKTTVVVTVLTASPVFSPAPGTFTSVQNVTITDATKGATIYYTTDSSAPTANSTKYTGAIKVSATETLQAIAVATGYSNSTTVSATYTINLPAAATPVFKPAAGTYTSAQNATITDSTAGATIYYTTDGSTPNLGSMVYKSAIKVSATETIQAIAAASGDSPSAVASATYTITPPAATPTFSPAAGTYTSVQTVSILDATPNASIYYTTNGSTPTATSAEYTGPITVSSTETVKAMAIAPGYSASAVGSAAYTVHLTATAPTFFPIPATYTSPVTVTLSDATSEATIYYTTNGSTPTTSSAKYSSAGITVSASETINALATAPGYAQSPVASAAYIVATAPSVTASAATQIGSSSATLNGTVTANGAPAQYWFAWGTSKTALTATTPSTGTGGRNLTTATPVSATLTGLKSKVTYYFQLAASNSVGTTYSPVLSFTSN
jgi:hypothetical protein